MVLRNGHGSSQSPSTIQKSENIIGHLWKLKQNNQIYDKMNL